MGDWRFREVVFGVLCQADSLRDQTKMLEPIILERIACHRTYFALNSEQAFMRPCLATKAARSGLDPGPLLGIIKDRPRNRVCG